MEQEELFEHNLRLLRINPKSLFISYGWDSDSHREWVCSLAEHLRRHDYEVIIDIDFDLPVEQFIIMAMHCRNILSVVTEKYMESCLMGKVLPTHEYSNLPSFSVVHGGYESSERYLELLNSAWTIWTGIQSGRRESIEREMSDLTVHDKFYFYYEGWCLDENQMILISEDKFDRIVLLYRSGVECFCRYPIIDFSNDKCFNQAVDSLFAYLNHKVIANHKGLRNPMLWRTTNNISGAEASTLLPIEFYQTDLHNLRFWKTSGTQRFVLRPSVNDKGEVATITNLFHDWEPI